MTQEEKKELVIKDLCGRLPYGVIVQVNDGLKCTYNSQLVQVFCDRLSCSVSVRNPLKECICIDSVKPYLRPMSSMTEEEKEDLLVTILGNEEDSKYFQVLQDGSIDNTDAEIRDLNKFNIHWVNFNKDTVTLYLDWLNKKMFDYRGLIAKGLAIEASKENNPYKD